MMKVKFLLDALCIWIAPILIDLLFSIFLDAIDQIKDGRQIIEIPLPGVEIA
jgi:hypothetical protein